MTCTTNKPITINTTDKYCYQPELGAGKNNAANNEIARLTELPREHKYVVETNATIAIPVLRGMPLLKLKKLSKMEETGKVCKDSVEGLNVKRKTLQRQNKSKIEAISSDIHQLQLIKLKHLKRSSDFLGINKNKLHSRLNSQCIRRLTSSPNGVDSTKQGQLAAYVRNSAT